jgi:prephenate dehydrogenase
MMFKQLGLIGCGLMGGSFSLALQRAGGVAHVVGFSPSAQSTERARQMGVIHACASSPEAAACGSDLVLLAVPVAATQANLAAIRPHISSNTLVMDVGSTKGHVMAAARAALGDKMDAFVAAHPIAGKELAGVAHADADLYRGKQVVLTPDPTTPLHKVQQARAVWQALGARVVEMSAQAHDVAYAAVSHLPHMLAFALMNALHAQSQAADFLALAGPGFRDFTRIAASDATIWRDIMLTNREALLAQSQQFQAALQAFDALLTQGDGQALESLIAQASRSRAQWHMS